LLLNRNDIDGAIERFDEQLELARETKSVQREGIALFNLGLSYARRGDLSLGIDFHNQAVLIFERMLDRGNLGATLYYLSRELADNGQTAEAITTAERALETYAELGDKEHVDGLNTLLGRFRRDLSTRLAPESSVIPEPTNESRGEGEAKIRDLASDYERTRSAMNASHERTQRMEEIVERMRLLVPAVYPAVGKFAASDSPGIRLAAVIILQNLPNSEYLDWLGDRLRIERPFIGYHASLALLFAVRELDMGHYNRIRDAIAKAKAGLDARDLKDNDRIKTLERADGELQQSWISRYFRPPEAIRTIGRLLKSGTFSQLSDQLTTGEVVVGLFLNQVPTLVAAYIPNEARRKQMERAQHLDGYFAVPFDQANEGMHPPIPTAQAGAPQSPRREEPNLSM
jgi:tetratricopeptide (TPR) repeat protein